MLDIIVPLLLIMKIPHSHYVPGTLKSTPDSEWVGIEGGVKFYSTPYYRVGQMYYVYRGNLVMSSLEFQAILSRLCGGAN